MDERIESTIEEVEEYFERLSEVRESSEGVARRESEENLVRKLVSATIYIASRIIALEGGSRPGSYAEYFEELNSRGVIGEDLSDDLVEMARFRNLIVHRYGEIDEEEMEDIIENDLQDIREFVKQVTNYYEED